VTRYFHKVAKYRAREQYNTGFTVLLMGVISLNCDSLISNQQIPKVLWDSIRPGLTWSHLWKHIGWLS